MRRSVLALALSMVFLAEAAPLLLVPPAQCCPLAGCPMHAKRAAAQFAPCPGHGDVHPLPPFLGRTAVVRAETSFARFGTRQPRVTFVARAITRNRGVETQPPREVWTAATKLPLCLAA